MSDGSALLAAWRSVCLLAGCRAGCLGVSARLGRQPTLAARPLHPCLRSLVATPGGEVLRSAHGSGEDFVFVPRNMVEAGVYTVAGGAGGLVPGLPCGRPAVSCPPASSASAPSHRSPSTTLNTATTSPCSRRLLRPCRVQADGGAARDAARAGHRRARGAAGGKRVLLLMSACCVEAVAAAA